MAHSYNRENRSSHPLLLHPAYKATLERAPHEPLVRVPQTLTEATGPTDWRTIAGSAVADLTKATADAPIGERIIVTGRILDEDGRVVPDTLVEIWQANSAGRYAHPVDQHDAPLDPNFSGAGRV